MTTRRKNPKEEYKYGLPSTKATATEKEMLRIINTEPSVAIVSELAKRGDPSEEVQRTLIHGRYPSTENDIDNLVKRTVAQNPAIGEQSQRDLISNEDPAVKIELARNRGLKQYLQLFLVIDKDCNVRMALAERTDLLIPAKEVLSVDPDPRVILTISTTIKKGKSTQFPESRADMGTTSGKITGLVRTGSADHGQ